MRSDNNGNKVPKLVLKKDQKTHKDFLRKMAEFTD